MEMDNEYRGASISNFVQSLLKGASAPLGCSDLTR
jgi:hypothetical protein